MTSDFTIPVIDFSKFLKGTPTEKAACAAQIIDVFTTSGFLYLKNYGIDKNMVKAAYANSEKFFALDQSQKDALTLQDFKQYAGYVTVGREKLSKGKDANAVQQERSTAGLDLKETYQIANEKALGNYWPPDEIAPGFKDTMLNFYDACSSLQLSIMSAIATGLGLDPHYFDKFMQVSNHTLRLLHYPEARKSLFTEKVGQVRSGAHSDYGCISLVFQDASGGLQVEKPDGSYIDATPIEDTIVVNSGDLLSRWSNDKITSTVHRVIQPYALQKNDEDTYPPRYSMAFFCYPDYDKVIECIEGCYSETNEKRYTPITTIDYRLLRLKATYG